MTMPASLRNLAIGSGAGALGGLAIPTADGEGFGARLERGAGGALLGGLAAGGYNARQGLDTLKDVRRAVKPVSHEVTSALDEIHGLHGAAPPPAAAAASIVDDVPSLSDLRAMQIPAAQPRVPAARGAMRPPPAAPSLGVADTLPVSAARDAARSAAPAPSRPFMSAMDDANRVPTRPDVMPSPAQANARTVATPRRAKAAAYEEAGFAEALALYGLEKEAALPALIPAAAAVGRGLMAAAPTLARGVSYLGRGAKALGRGALQGAKALPQGGAQGGMQALQGARNTAGVYGRGAQRAFGQAGQQFAQQAPAAANMARRGGQLLGKGWNAMNTPMGMAATTAGTMALS